jgi:hypothetical protein
MNKAPSLALLVVVGVLVLSAAAGAPAATTPRPLSVHQEPRGLGNLVAPGDRVEIVYTVDTPGVTSATGALFVRNDRMRRFVRVRLTPSGGSSLHAYVPARIVRGGKLVYFATIRDPESGRSARLPTRRAFVLGHAVVVRLGKHVFDQPAAPETIVARAPGAALGWQIPPPGQGPKFGPQTFLVGADGSVWLDDSLNNRLLVYAAGAPDTVVRTIPLPSGSADSDVALGPEGTVYVTGAVGHGLGTRPVLYRIAPDGRILWRAGVAAAVGEAGAFLAGANAGLRVGPSGNVYYLVGMFGLPGGEQGWMPVATVAGAPVPLRGQRPGTHWPFQPLGHGLRLVSEVYAAVTDGAPREARYALVDRRGRVVRSWCIRSKTDINFTYATPELVGDDLVVVIDPTAFVGGELKWEHEVLRLGTDGLRTSLSLSLATFGDNVLTDVRMGPDGKLYQLASSPDTGVVISRFSLD